MSLFRPQTGLVPNDPVPAITAGLTVIVVGLLGFLIWAVMADIASAVVAQGTVKVLSNRKVVQASQPGVVREIAVRDGDAVAAGDVLVRLDDSNARSSLSIVQSNYDLLRATVARLRAERVHADTVTFPDDLLARAGDPAVADLLDGQRRFFDARQGELAGQADIQRERIGQLDEEIQGLTTQLQAKKDEIAVVASQQADMTTLLEKGLIQRSQVAALERDGLRLQGELAEVEASISRDLRLKSEAQLEVLRLTNTFDKEVNDELGAKETEMFELAERAAAAQRELDQTVIRATANGIIVGLGVHTVGGVVQEGAHLLEIVPTEDNLVIEAQIRPVDMDNVAVGLDVDVVFPAFAQRNLLRMSGQIGYVSADALTDDRTGISYYLAEVNIDDGQLARLGAFKLLPGMPAEVFVKTGQQSPLAYLTQPLRDSLTHAWREP